MTINISKEPSEKIQSHGKNLYKGQKKGKSKKS